MKLSNELIKEVKDCKSSSEILDLAKKHDITISEEEADKVFAQLHKKGELQDEELNNIAGGCGSIEEPKYYVGQHVRFSIVGFSNKTGVITERQYSASCWVYNIKFDDDSEMVALNVFEREISAL